MTDKIKCPKCSCNEILPYASGTNYKRCANCKYYWKPNVDDPPFDVSDLDYCRYSTTEYGKNRYNKIREHLYGKGNQMTEELKSIKQVTSSLDQKPPQKSTSDIQMNDMWSRLISRYSLETVFKTDLCRDIRLGFLHEVKNLMVERRQLGIDRYGTVLQAFNGRNAIDDLLAEQLDSIAYSEQVSLENPELTETMMIWQKFIINEMQKLIDFKDRKNANSKEKS